jgi:hypothetical protein
MYDGDGVLARNDLDMQVDEHAAPPQAMLVIDERACSQQVAHVD